MAEAAGVSVTSVQRIWRAHGSSPSGPAIRLSKDPEFVDKLRHIVGLYVDPPAHAIVLSVGQKSQIQALDRTQPGLPIGAICPARGVGAVLALPYADADMMQLHLDEISRNVADGAHAVLLLDRAGWHTTGKLDVPDNITPIFLPSRAPELNPVQNIWRYLRQNWLSTPCSKTTTQSSTPHAPLGENSSLNPKRSPQSECATGLMSVRNAMTFGYQPTGRASRTRSTS